MRRWIRIIALTLYFFAVFTCESFIYVLVTCNNNEQEVFEIVYDGLTRQQVLIREWRDRELSKQRMVE